VIYCLTFRSFIIRIIYKTYKKEFKILTSSITSPKEIKEKSELHYFHYYDDAGDALIKSFESKKIAYGNYRKMRFI